MAGMFDDLIPAAPAAAPAPAAPTAGLFDDLLPTSASIAARAAPLDPTAVASPPRNPGTIVPISDDAQGNPHFDPNAGVLGMAKTLLNLPTTAMNAASDLSYAGAVQRASDPGSAAYVAAGNQAADAAGSMLGTAAAVSPLAPAARSLGGAAGLAMGPSQAATPSIDALKSAASAGYDQARGMGVDYSADAVKNLAAQMRSGLEQDGILAELAPKTHAILSKLEAVPTTGDPVMPFGGIEAARRALGQAGRDFNNPTDQLASGRVVSGLDDFVSAADPASVVAGRAGDVASVVGDARANYAAAKRAEFLTGVSDEADLKASAANSGDNIGNKLRARAAAIVSNPKLASGFNDDELESLRTIAQGTIPQNLSRRVGNIFGGGGGLAALEAGQAGALAGFGAGGMTGGALGMMALPTIGYASREAANRMTQSALDRLIDQTSQRSPLFTQMQAAAPLARPQDQPASNLFRMMMANGLTQQAP